MTPTAQTIPCPRCAAPMPAKSSAGVCPACALQQVLREEDAPGRRRLGRYRLLEPLGRGGMGSVWLAEDTALDRLVALKMLPQEILTGAGLAERLRREARAVASLNHPHVIAIYEVGEEGETVFLAMEFVEGGDLRERLGSGPLESGEAVRWLLQATSAVAHAHAAGIHHRDLKPANVLLTAAGQVRLADFGLAAAQGGRGDLTLDGQALGTPAYMAPEMAAGEPTDERVDLYGLGAVLYEMLTGRPPFTGRTTAAILTSVSEEEPVPPRALVATVDLDLETICLKCLEKEPARRYSTARHLEADLTAWLEGRPIAARPVSRAERVRRWARRHPGAAWGLGGVAAALLALAVVSTGAAWSIGRERDRAEVGEAEARSQLQSALIARARDTRGTGRPGQRVASLVALGESARIGYRAEARDEAVAALALPELVEARRWKLPVASPARAAFDPAQDRFVVEALGETGLTVHRVADNGLVVALEVASAVRGTPVWSPNGHFLAARFADGVLRVWSVPDGVLRWSRPESAYPGGENSDQRGHDLLFDPTSTSLGLALEGGGYVLVDAATGAERWRWEDARRPRAADISPDGRRLALADFRDFQARFKVVVIDLGSGETVTELTGFGSGQGVAWHPGGELLAVAGSNRVDLIRVRDAYQLRRYEVPDGPALRVWWSADGHRLFAWSDRARFRVWDVASGELAFSWYERVPLGTRFGVSADGGRLLTAGDEWAGVEWRWSPSPVHRTLVPPAGSFVFQIAPAPGTLDFSPDGEALLVSGLDRLVVLDRATGAARLDRALSAAEGGWTTARFGADANEIWWSAKRSGLRHLRLQADASATGWALAAEEQIDPTPGFLISDVQRETGLAGLASYDTDRFRVLDLARRSVVWEEARAGAFEIVFGPRPGTFLTARLDESSERGPILESGSLAGGLGHAPLEARNGGTVRWSAESDRIVAVTDLRVVKIWDAAHPAQAVAVETEFAHALGTYAISPDGHWVAAYGSDGLALVDARTGAAWARLTPPPDLYGEVRELRFSPDARWLAVLRRNGVVGLWDLAALRRELRALSLD